MIFWALLFVVLTSPLALGAVFAWAWGGLAIAAGLLLLFWSLGCLFGRIRPAVGHVEEVEVAVARSDNAAGFGVLVLSPHHRIAVDPPHRAELRGKRGDLCRRARREHRPDRDIVAVTGLAPHQPTARERGVIEMRRQVDPGCATGLVPHADHNQR